ncbi:MAG: histidine kinase dimerization/phospho-acceptor domain-containing protein [Vicinamibacterales bacterium]
MRALSVLIHDLRAPLSVASGYLRLIREDRLTSIEDRDRALIGAIEAVRRMSRLCDEASDFGSARESMELPTVLVSADDLAARVCSALQSEGTPVEPSSIGTSGYVRVTRADRIAAAVASILRPGLRQRVNGDPVGLEVVGDGQGLRFLVGTAAQRSELKQSEAPPLDPWRGGHGLQLPIACRDLQRIAGRVWTTASGRLAIGVHLPLEASAS